MPINLKDNNSAIHQIGKIYYKDNNSNISELAKAYWKDINSAISEVFSSSPDSSSLYAVVNGRTLVKLDNSFDITRQINLPVSPVGMCIDNDENVYILSYSSPSAGRYVCTVHKYNSEFTLQASKDFYATWPSGVPAGTSLYPVLIMYNSTVNSIFVNCCRPRADDIALWGMAKLSLDLATAQTGSYHTYQSGSDMYSSPYGIYYSRSYEGRDEIYSVNLALNGVSSVLGSYRWITGGDNTLGYLNITAASPYPTVPDGSENFYAPHGIISSIRAPSGYRGCYADCKFYKSNNRDAIMKYNMPLGASGYCLTDRYTLSTAGIQSNDPFNGAFMNGAVDSYDLINIKS